MAIFVHIPQDFMMTFGWVLKSWLTICSWCWQLIFGKDPSPWRTGFAPRMTPCSVQISNLENSQLINVFSASSTDLMSALGSVLEMSKICLRYKTRNYSLKLCLNIIFWGNCNVRCGFGLHIHYLLFSKIEIKIF